MPDTLVDATKDYYGILGVQPNATTDEIRMAGKRKAMKLHPDRIATGDEAAFKLVQEAREVLGSQESRAFYDQMRIQYQTTKTWSWSTPGPGQPGSSSGRQQSHHQTGPQPKKRQNIFDHFPYRDLREFIVSSLNFFSEDLEIIFPNVVTRDFQAAAKYVFAIWREIGPDIEGDEVTVEYGGFQITVANLKDLDL